MSKIENDKYYTSQETVDRCLKLVKEHIGLDKITAFIEPSAGNGAFLSKLHETNTPIRAYDIEPEYEDIIQADYLETEENYQKGLCTIGNPPFGRCNALATKFYKKATKTSEYIAFILPLSQLNNTKSLYEFDLIHSEDLGETLYTDRLLHCCFNIYRRPENGILNKKQTTTLKSIKIYRQDSKKFRDPKTPYDLILCYWGNGSAGKVVNEAGTYSAEYKIHIDDIPEKAEIIKKLSDRSIVEGKKYIAMRKIQQFHVIDFIKDNFENVE
jgi:hypothetical protein